MRACSFLPASTQMIYELGLEDRLYGVTFECPSDKPKIVRSRLEGMELDSAAIDRLVSETAARGETLYYLDFPLLEAAAPDVIFTQHVCDVCQIGTAFVERAVHRLPKVPRLVALVPRKLEEVVGNAQTIGRELDGVEAARALVTRTRRRMDAVSETLHAAGIAPVRALVLEWLDPLYNCGHWIPEQITLAGGTDLLAAPAGYSVPMDWERVVAYDPDVIVVAPCGFEVARAAAEIDRLTGRPGFAQLRAARSGRVFVADARMFTQPSPSELASGVELLAHLLHPSVFGAPAHAAGRFARAG
jgi:iron complex transport system substrate-binding protein